MTAPINDKDLEVLRSKYGKVTKVTFRNKKNQQDFIVVRKPDFKEYLFFNKNATNIADPNEAPYYEIDPEALSTLFSALVVYPENTTINDIPAGNIVQAVLSAVSLVDFENEEQLRQLYIKNVKSANTILGVIMTKIVALYGIDGYKACKGMSEDELMELIVYGEIIQEQPGSFAMLTNMQDLPFTKVKGSQMPILDVEALINGDTESHNEEHHKVNPLDDQKRKRLEMHYASLGLSPQEVAEKLDELENQERFDFSNLVNPGMIDPHSDDDDSMTNMSKSEYEQAQKDGKVLSFEESQNMAMEKSKSALAQKIAEDKAKFANNKKKDIDKGELTKLLNEVKTQTREL